MMQLAEDVPPVPVFPVIFIPSSDPMKRPRKRLNTAIVVDEVAWKTNEEAESQEITCKAPGALIVLSAVSSETGDDWMMLEIKTS